MKKVFLAVFLVVSVANAHTGHYSGNENERMSNAHTGHYSGNENERMSIVWNFVTAALLATGLNHVSKRLQLSAASHGVLQVANGLWALGSIADNLTFNDLAVRSVLAAASMTVASQPQVRNLAASTPFIGQALAKSGEYLTGMLVISSYKTLEIGLGKFCHFANQRGTNLSFCQQ